MTAANKGGRPRINRHATAKCVSARLGKDDLAALARYARTVKAPTLSTAIRLAIHDAERFRRGGSAEG